ncbi:hypothetical protein FRC09_007062 [Ceratobasidium sp. 395]|nr:hypothetical protein FRC09_007062 [Ceratobasidium sp. 395]
MAITFCLYGAFRSGSLQANNPMACESKMGYSGPVGHQTVLTFGPVSKAHNLNFEALLYFALHLLGRGAFED